MLAGPFVIALILTAPAPAGLRAVAAGALFLVGPGLAWTPILGLHRDRLLAAVTVVTVSLSLDVIATQMVMWQGGLRWQPVAWLLVLLTVVGAIVQLVRRDRSW
jgi:hypothetical protein